MNNSYVTLKQIDLATINEKLQEAKETIWTKEQVESNLEQLKQTLQSNQSTKQAIQILLTIAQILVNLGVKL